MELTKQEGKGSLQAELSKETIKADIKSYQDRLSKVQERLDALPPKGCISPEGRKLKRDRRELEVEIEHVKRLIGYAEGALDS